MVEKVEAAEIQDAVEISEGAVRSLGRGRQRHAFQFLKAFIRNPGSVGAIVPSAPELARAMVQGLHVYPGESLLELGPGTGAFTHQIYNMLPDSAGYLGIEREEGFVTLLEQKFPDLQFVAASAEDATLLHATAGLGPVRVIISSLPFATLITSVRENIISNLEQLMAPGCVFRTFQYVHAYPLPSAIRFRRDMEARFGSCHRSPAILQNVPPAYVLTWER